MIEHDALHNRLYRIQRERMIAGVAGGVAEYLNIETWLVRVAFLALIVVTGGTGLLVYIVLAIAVPERPVGDDELEVPSPPLATRRGREIAGYALAGVGLLILAGNLGLFRIFEWRFMFPALLVGIGLFLLLRQRREI